MTDGTTTMSMLEEHELFTIEKLLDEYVDADNTIPAIAWRRLLSDYRTLQSRLEQQHWDAISRDQTIENLRAENRRFREALEFYACDDTYLPVMEGDGTPITGTVVVLHDGGHIARVALGYEEETWFNPRDAAYPDRFIAHAQSDIPALLKTIAELREALEFYAVHGGECARAALGKEVTS